MKKQTITWTALPNGSDGPLAEGTTLRVSAFVSPRLWNDDAGVTKMALSEFPDFLDWPAVIAATSFQVEFDGGAAVDATFNPAVLRSDLWQSLFKAETDVIPFVFEDLTGATILTFPSATIHDTVKGVYQRAATDPAYGAGLELPDAGTLAEDDDLKEIARPVRPEPEHVPVDPDRGPVVLDEPQPEPTGKGCRDRWRPGCCGPLGCLGLFSCLTFLLIFFVLLARLVGRLFKLIFSAFPLGATVEVGGEEPLAGGGGGPGPGAKQEAFADLNDYVAPTSLVSQPLPTQEEIEETFDFHQMVASLGDYPNLLRYLGLVVDLEVTLPADLPAASGTVRIVPTLTTQTTTSDYRPRTHYELGEELFRAQARPTGSDISEGLLRLNDASLFRVQQVDVAGGGIKLQNTATTVVGLRTLNEWPPNNPEKTGLPALQTAGISIVRPEKGAVLSETFYRSYALNAALAAVDGSPLPAPAGGAPPPPADDELFADDLVRGYRIDVWDDKSEAWHSLCQRIGTYTFLDPPGGGTLALNDEEDEGFVQMGVTEALEEEAARTLRAHDSLFTWDGWSLCAPRPGDTILPDHSTGEPANAAVTGFQMETSFRAKPGTLPRLRFGYDYRLRARVVDLAGNSTFLPGSATFAADQAEITPPFTFRRFEPVSPPPLMLRTEPKEGESLERLTVRSTVEDAPATITAQTSERHLVPPKTAQLMAERHRRFDGSPGMDSSQAAYDLASAEAGSLTHRLDLVTGTHVLLNGVQEVDDPATNRTFWLQTNEQFEVAYLPDPFARGVLLLGLPGMTAFEEIVEPDGQIVNKIPFTGTWPNVQALRLRLVGLPAGDAPGQPTWDGVGRVLTVELPQGERVHVRISSYFHPDDLEQMAIWGWTEEIAPPDLEDLRATAAAGRNWLQLPYRTLVLVHAVQQPLQIPAFGQLAVAPDRTLGDTGVSLALQLDVDGKSTGKVDVWAAWSDPFDDPSKPTYDAATDVVNQEMHVAELSLEEGSGDLVDFADVRHAIGDLKYHQITYTPLATTRFREYFPAAVTADPQNLRRPLPSEGPQPTVLDVPNARRPDGPLPQYVLPTFHWSETVAGDVITRVRQGGGLRVYMDRPWFSSGAGELLGVLVAPPGIDPLSERMMTLGKYSSQWGMDPIWPAAETAPLRLADLEDATEVGHNLSVAGLPGEVVHVAGYTPQYDTERNLWFADVKLDAGAAYFPFVRLALARFQPISVPDAHLSPVVLADFVQAAPERTVAYDLSNLDPGNTLHVRMNGPSYFRPQQEQFGSPLVAVRIERRQHGDAGDDPLGWEVVATQLLSPTVQGVEETVWEGTVTLPTLPAQPLRAVVLEAEVFLTDRQRWEDVLAAFGQEVVAGDDPAGTAILQRQPRGYRIVFADSIKLP